MTDLALTTLAECEAVIERGLASPEFRSEVAALRRRRESLDPDAWGYYCASSLELPPSIVDMLIDGMAS